MKNPVVLIVAVCIPTEIAQIVIAPLPVGEMTNRHSFRLRTDKGFKYKLMDLASSLHAFFVKSNYHIAGSVRSRCH